MDRALGARASNRVILDEAEETNKGQILVAGGGEQSKECGLYSKDNGKLMEDFSRGLAK